MVNHYCDSCSPRVLEVWKKGIINSLCIIIIIIINIITTKATEMNKKVLNETSIVAGSDTANGKSISVIMKEYIDSYLPYVYKEGTRTEQLSRQLLLNHKYFSILTNTKNSIDKTSKWIDGFHVLSMVSANMFILAVLFDLRYPADDGSCVTYDSEEDCLYRKTVFNTYCDWQPSSSPSCTFSEPKFDLVSVITLAWLQLIISVPIRTVVHYLFDNIIYAATSTTIENQIKENQVSTRTAVANQLIRRMSNAISAVSSVSRQMSNMITVKIKDVRALSMSVRTTITLQGNFADLRYRYHHYHYH